MGQQNGVFTERARVQSAVIAQIISCEISE